MSELVRLAKEALKQQQALDPGLKAPTIQPGAQITWDRAGTAQTGTVDFLHEDTDGTTWAFCTIGATWSAVNVKFARVMTDLKAAPAAKVATCFGCGGTRRWMSVHGAVLCATCRPPSDPDLVTRWIEPEGGDTPANDARDMIDAGPA